MSLSGFPAQNQMFGNRTPLCLRGSCKNVEWQLKVVDNTNSSDSSGWCGEIQFITHCKLTFQIDGGKKNRSPGLLEHTIVNSPHF